MFLNQGPVSDDTKHRGNKALNSPFLELYSAFITRNSYWNLFIYTGFISGEDLVLNFYSNKTFLFKLIFLWKNKTQIDSLGLSFTIDETRIETETHKWHISEVSNRRMFTFWANESIVFSFCFIRSEGWKKVSYAHNENIFWFMICQISVMTSFKRDRNPLYGSHKIFR